MNQLKVVFGLLKETVHNWSEHKAPRLGAALAYYTVFSLAPLLVIVLAVAGMIFGKAGATDAIIRQVKGTVGEPVGRAIGEMVQSADNPASGTVATVIGVIILLFGAAGVFGQLQDALNTVWEVAPKPGRGVWGMIKDRFLSLGMVLGTCFLLLVSLVISAALSAVGKWTEALPGGSVMWEVVNNLVAFGVITLLFAMIFKILPDATVGWGDVWIGAAATALLFTVGKYVLGLYLGREGVASAYGAAGSLVIILLWVYYSSQILLFGAEFTRVYADHYGSHIRPAENAVPLTREALAQQGTPRTEDVQAAAEKPQPSRAGEMTHS